MRITFVDTETGGFYCSNHAILEVALVSGVAINGTFTEESCAHIYIRPNDDLDMNLGALKVNQTLDRVPMTNPGRISEEDAAKFLKSYFQWASDNGYHVWAQRDEFDYGFIRELLDRHRQRDKKVLPSLSNFQCLKRAFRLAKALGHHAAEKDSLKDICAYFKVKNEHAHDALSDARASAHCVAGVLKMYGH